MAGRPFQMILVVHWRSLICSVDRYLLTVRWDINNEVYIRPLRVRAVRNNPIFQVLVLNILARDHLNCVVCVCVFQSHHSSTCDLKPLCVVFTAAQVATNHITGTCITQCVSTASFPFEHVPFYFLMTNHLALFNLTSSSTWCLFAPLFVCSATLSERRS